MNPQSQLPPPQAKDTLDWLIVSEEFSAARALIAAIARRLPADHPEASDFIASALMRSKHYQEAVAQARHTLMLMPQSSGAKFNLAKCLNAAAMPEEAEHYMRQVVEASPRWVDPKIDLAVYIAAQGRVDEAMALLQTILATIDPSDPNVDVVRFNLGWHFIRSGDFKKGIRYLGLGRKLRIWGAHGGNYSRPCLPDGADVCGKTILVIGEGGAGDEIINVRFAETIAARGGRVLWVTGQGFEQLFRSVSGVSAVLTHATALGADYDFWAPAMDLPRILGVDAPELERGVYIHPDAALVDRWRQLIPQRPGRLRVGLRWQGNQLYEQDLMRSVPFTMLAGLTDIAGIDFYSLQRDGGVEERPVDSPVVDLAPELKTWAETAAAIANLDLIISSCTSVPHLAAAMGKSTWILCPINAYYVWALPGKRSPWYPQAVTLYRQVKPRCWIQPYRELREQLRELVANGDLMGHSSREQGLGG